MRYIRPMDNAELSRRRLKYAVAGLAALAGFALWAFFLVISDLDMEISAAALTPAPGMGASHARALSPSPSRAKSNIPDKLFGSPGPIPTAKNPKNGLKLFGTYITRAKRADGRLATGPELLEAMKPSDTLNCKAVDNGVECDCTELDPCSNAMDLMQKMVRPASKFPDGEVSLQAELPTLGGTAVER